MIIKSLYAVGIDADGNIYSKGFSPASEIEFPDGLTIHQFDNENDYNAFVASIVPVKTKDQQKADILAQLSALDEKSIRPLRENDTARIATYNAQAADLRAQLKALGV